MVGLETTYRSQSILLGPYTLLIVLSNTTATEHELWAIFHCLARACLVMHHGSEDATIPTPGWPAQELVHFDLKPENREIFTWPDLTGQRTNISSSC